MVGQFGLFVILAVALVAGVADALPPQKIAGGSLAAPGEFPYQVSLRVRGKHFCGGTIISKRHIITAAHCVLGVVTRPYSDLVIVTGTVLASRGQTHKVDVVLYHPQYQKGVAASPNDIAIVVLSQDMTFNSAQNKINLPTAPTPTGVQATVTGWGYRSASVPVLVEQLYKLRVTTLTAAECQNYLAQISVLYTHQICSYAAPGSGFCQGDSGGPLAYNNQFIGIVSYNVPCAAGYPDVYSSVYHYVDWINQVIGSL